MLSKNIWLLQPMKTTDLLFLTVCNFLSTMDMLRLKYKCYIEFVVNKDIYRIMLTVVKRYDIVSYYFFWMYFWSKIQSQLFFDS